MELKTAQLKQHEAQLFKKGIKQAVGKYSVLLIVLKRQLSLSFQCF